MNSLTLKIKDIGKVKGGKRLSDGYFVQDTKTTHPYIRVTNMKPNGLDASDIKYVPDNAYEKIKNYTISSKDIYLSIAGTIGLIGKLPENLSGANLTENAAKITNLNIELIDRDYLLYFLRSSLGQNQIKSRISGSSQPKLALEKIATIEIPKIPKNKQYEISSILSTYDNLIEKNEKRIKILEEMAQRLYAEWFVKFKFMGHEKVKLVDSHTSFGMIPEGWNIGTISKASTYISRGISPRYDENGDSRVINQKCIRDHKISLEPSRKQSKDISIDKLLRFGDILINSTGVGTLGRVAQVYENFYKYTVDSHVTIVRPTSDKLIDYLGLTVISNQANFELLGKGATGQTELSRESIMKFPIMIPTEQILQDFSYKVKNWRLLIIKQLEINKNLINFRDLLIPQLITGKREVK